MLAPVAGADCAVIFPDHHRPGAALPVRLTPKRARGWYRRALAAAALAVLPVFLFTSGFPASASSHRDTVGVVTVYGKVMDSSDGHPLAFASVTHAGSGVSNVSNSEGIFSLKLPSDSSSEDEIRVSFLGYVTATLRVRDFSESTSDKPRRVPLPPVSFSLDPAVIRSTEPLELLREAYAKVKDNYPSVMTGMTAFYREIIRRQSGRYLALSEAVIDINKASYTSFQGDRARIFKGRASSDYGVADSILIRFRGGVVAALDMDNVKNPFAGVWLNEVNLHYRFAMAEPVVRDGLFFYVITFTQAEGSEDILYSGRLYVESESLAIGRVELSLNVKGREEKAAAIMVIKRPPDTRFYVTKAEYAVNYKRFGDVWHYDYSVARLNLSARRGKSLFRNHYSITSEMAVTAHNEVPARIGADERIRFKDILSEKVGDFRDDDFWGDYNVIEPDKSIDAVIRRIIRRLERRGTH